MERRRSNGAAHATNKPEMRFFGLAMALALGCGGPDANAPGRPLPPYTGHATEVFDDSIEAAAVGLNLDEAAPSSRTDAPLRERTQTGDAVVRAKIETVTASDDMDAVKYTIGLRVLQVLTGDHPPAEQFSVVVNKSSPAIGIVKGFDARLGGKSFVAFVKEFQQGDERRFHFHFAPDTKDVIGAVKEAVDLGEYSK
jgi:hypothetical protein